MKLDRRLLNEARSARRDLVLTVGLGLLAAMLVVGQARLLSLVVSRVFLEGRSLGQVQSLLLAFLGLSLGRTALVWGSEVAAGRVAGRVKADLRDQLAAQILVLGPAYTRDEQSGELANTVIEGIEALDAYFRHYLPQLALAALVPMAVLLFVFPLDWVSGLVLLLTAPLIPVFMVLIGNTAESLTRRQWTSLSRMSARLLDALQGLTTLKLFGRSREQVRLIAQISDQYRQTTMGVLRVTFLSALVLEMVATISTAVVAVQVGLRLLYGHLAFQDALFVLLLAPEFYLPLRLLGTRFHAGMAGVSAARRIFEVLDTASPSPSVSARSEMEKTFKSYRPSALALGACRFHLCFDDVAYAYDEGRRSALEGISFEVEPGQKVALVGPSGAGKSTVAHLLLRFIEPLRGAISVDGYPLSDLSAQVWREQIAWVPQSPYLFHGTVVENIRLARPAASHDQVVRAAQQASAHNFIEALPQGYETLVGEQGTRLSGGEAQRIALARAFLKGAPLLILDEATANLDPEIEDQIQAAIERLLTNRTALLIAHRLGTTYSADRIVVIDRGRVVEQGSHEALLEQHGVYRRLVAAYGAGGAA